MIKLIKIFFIIIIFIVAIFSFIWFKQKDILINYFNYCTFIDNEEDCKGEPNCQPTYSGPPCSGNICAAVEPIFDGCTISPALYGNIYKPLCEKTSGTWQENLDMFQGGSCKCPAGGLFNNEAGCLFLEKDCALHHGELIDPDNYIKPLDLKGPLDLDNNPTLYAYMVEGQKKACICPDNISWSHMNRCENVYD